MPTRRCGYKPERNLGSLKVVGAHATIASTNAHMTNFKTLIAAALVSGFAVASFAQAPAAPKDAAKAAPAVTAPADATAKPATPVKKHVVRKHAAKKVEKATTAPKAEAAAPAVSAAK